MADIIMWPICVLRPQSISAMPVPFTRSGGRSLGGLEPTVRTDLGFWQIDYRNIVLQGRSREAWQTWQAIRQNLGGRSGRIAVPVRSSLSAPYPSGAFEPMAETAHSDESLFDDDTPYVQGAISVVSDGVTSLGATVIRMRVINAAPNLVGVRFSYNHALYETGPAIGVSSGVWEVPISPPVRAVIPHGADLEFDRPTCLCHLAEDQGMEVSQDAIQKFALPSVSFVEDTDYWNKLALGIV